MTEPEIIETEIEGDTSTEEEEATRFEVSSYGWDSDVEGLVKRLIREDIKIPEFQRNFVWSQVEQSRFIESLIIGLPVPNIFLSQDVSTRKLNIVDGQQRLLSLYNYMVKGFPLSSSISIQEDLRGKYYTREVAKTDRSSVLEDEDARRLNDAILHSIVVKPESQDESESASEYNKAIIQIFKRLNTSGKALQAQEVRSCVFHGAFNKLLQRLNQNEDWRALFGTEHTRLKDVEAILRFFALFKKYEDYRATMPRFLDEFMEENRELSEGQINEFERIFNFTVNKVRTNLGDGAFKNRGTFLLSTFDAVMVGIAKSEGLTEGNPDSKITNGFKTLKASHEFIYGIEEFVNDVDRVQARVGAAIAAFS